MTIAMPITAPSCGLWNDERHAERRSARRARCRWRARSATRARRPAGVRFGQLVGRQRPNHDRQRLRAGIAAHPSDDRHQRGEHRIVADLALEQADDAAAKIAVPRLMTSQNKRRRTVSWIGSLMSPSPAPDSSSDVLAGFFLDDVDDVIDGDHADQPARIVDHGGRHQRIFLEAQRDVLLVHVDRDQGLLARHDVADRRRARGAQDRRQLAGSDRVVVGLTTNTSQKSVGRSSVERR